jgi:CheY-like chemotaxis protein
LENPGAELLDLATKFEEVMGFAKDEQAEEPEEVEHKTEAVAAKQERPPEKKEDDEEPVEEPEEERAKSSKTRDFKRVKFKKKVLVNNQIMVEALDISENGLFLHTGRSFDDGAIVEVGIPTVPGSFDLMVQAKVKHNHRSIGMGMEFVNLDDKQKTRLNTLISELDAAAKELEGRKKILLVGGTDTARNINKSKLVLDGFYVLQATTADEVFQILEEEPPDAMVLEWQETTFYCKGLLAQIKEKSQYDAIIRVVLSALTDTYVQREIIDAGAHRYMAKMNTNPAKLSLTLKNLIDERDS